MLVPLLMFAIVSSFTPGPNNIISMTHARKYGYQAALKFIGGVAAGCFAIMLLSGYFNFALYQWIPRVKFALDLLGGLYLLYLAVKIIRSKPQQNEDPAGTMNTFWFGLFFQFINPKVILYGFTAISSFVMPVTNSRLQLVMYSLLLTVVGVSANLTWALGGRLFQRFLERHERAFNVVMGLLLIYSAVSIFAN